MNPGERLFKFLAGLILEKFYGSVTIKFEAGKVTHVETETRRHWEYANLPVRSEGTMAPDTRTRSEVTGQ